VSNVFLTAVSRLKRTRVQILLGFIIVMIVVLSVVGGMSYRLTSDLFIRNTKAYLAETAAQASARVDAVLAQLDTISLQLVMDARLQKLLYMSKHGMPISVEQRLSVRPMVDNLSALSWLISGIDVYTEDEPLYPLENKKLTDVIGKDALALARSKPGQLVWAETSPDDPNVLIAVRQVRLEQDYLAGGGYVVIKVMNSMVNFFNEEFSAIKGSSMHLFDQQGKLIVSTAPSIPDIEKLSTSGGMQFDNAYNSVRLGGEDYLHIIKQSKQLHWSIHILVPLRTVTEQLSILKHLMLYAFVAGLGVCMILSWLLSERITMPIGKLRKKMRNVHFSLPETNDETYFNLEMNELNMAYNKLVRDLHVLVETVYEKERLKNMAEIKMLQAQIHPHFLFNTLESLYWNLTEKKDRESAGMVIALSKLFRYSIKTSEGDDLVLLSEEIEHCRRYLEIMKYRLAHRLTWDIYMEEGAGSVHVPKLLVQPLVENAIQHGIERKIGPGTVTVDIRTVHWEEAPALRIQVRDDGPGMSEEQLEQLRRRLSGGKENPVNSAGGIGLMNVEKRVKMHYGDKYGLRLNSSPGAGTETNLYLPYGVDVHAGANLRIDRRR
jgi:two-component system sensor histidine kinase YesM